MQCRLTRPYSSERTTVIKTAVEFDPAAADGDDNAGGVGPVAVTHSVVSSGGVAVHQVEVVSGGNIRVCAQPRFEQVRAEAVGDDVARVVLDAACRPSQ